LSRSSGPLALLLAAWLLALGALEAPHSVHHLFERHAGDAPASDCALASHVERSDSSTAEVEPLAAVGTTGLAPGEASWSPLTPPARDVGEARAPPLRSA
jgi:hypothetical protein